MWWCLPVVVVVVGPPVVHQLLPPDESCTISETASISRSPSLLVSMSSYRMPTVMTANMTNSTAATVPDSSVRGGRTLEYWGNASADISGMLGGVPDVSGFSSIHRVDIQGSRTFLAKLGIGLKDGRHRVKSVLEGGAGCVACDQVKLGPPLIRGAGLAGSPRAYSCLLQTRSTS